MNIYFNGQPQKVYENLTFQQLFQQTGQQGNFNDKIWCRNGIQIQINGFQYVKDYLSENDNLTTQQGLSYRMPAFTSQINSLSQNANQINRSTTFIPPGSNSNTQNFMPNQINQKQNIIIKSIQQSPNPQFQGSQINQAPQNFNNYQQQNFVQNQTNIQQSSNFQIQNNDNNDCDIFATKADPNEVDDVFATSFIYQNYEQNRQTYLQNKNNNPGKQYNQYERDGYRFILDNYGDTLIIEKLDQSLYLKINNSFKLNSIRQFNIQNKQKEFESNIILELNCTRVSWIQNLDVLAVQFNTGRMIVLQFYLE